MPQRCCAAPPLPMTREKSSRSKCFDGDEACVNPCCKRCASKRRARYLQPDMFSKILLHLPGQGSHGVRRRLCKEWNLVTRTQTRIHDQLRNSTCGVIIQDWGSPRNGFYVEMRRGSLEVCKFDCGFESLVWSSCNGLVLAPDCTDPHILSVINPMTKQWATLPPFPSRTGYYSEFTLAYVEASLEYKVVQTRGSEPLGLNPRIAVLTIGVDKVWRHIDIQQLSLTTRGALTCSPFVTRGYIHWTGFDFVLTLNVETETIRRFPMPRLLEGRKEFLPTGSNLSIFNESRRFLMDVWEMNPETGEWTMLLSFDLKPLKDRFKDLFRECLRPLSPSGWLADMEVLLVTSLYTRKLCVAYNIKTREIQSLELDSHARLNHLKAHVNSLLWLERGFRVDRLQKRQGIPLSRLSCS